jgi:exodeoxyribonuclease V alpha subunit
VSENLFYTNKEQNEHLPADIKGAIEKITFRNDETGYTVAHLIPASGGDSITILGVFSSLFPGESLRCQGTWIRHPKWGLQVQVQTYESIRPATAIGIRKYLGSGMVKGIGPVMAGRIVDKFGAQSLETIENSPDLLAKVPGIGAKRVDMIRSAWMSREIWRTEYTNFTAAKRSRRSKTIPISWRPTCMESDSDQPIKLQKI